MFFHTGQKITKSLDSFWMKICFQKLQKSPNLVTPGPRRYKLYSVTNKNATKQCTRSLEYKKPRIWFK